MVGQRFIYKRYVKSSLSVSDAQSSRSKGELRALLISRLYIFEVAQLDDGSVVINFFESTNSGECELLNTPKAGTTTKITAQAVERQIAIFEPGSQVLISTAKVAKPRVFLTTTVTTTETTIEDELPWMKVESTVTTIQSTTDEMLDY